ncbi:uncharacterized protein LOC112088441 [Eutrema salsugineum]|uniref:uncharacterized protein LOC112088441 n=1 Tax=Eutrema salsugineum TaxID=72664 RepID=UPI000CED04F3|nr:uncharacterized protein LOC112088441 [Eutrema salsugineum]
MMHGPCGAAKPDNVCMVNGKCSKSFPRPFNDETLMDSNGFPSYRRCRDNRVFTKNGINLDNGYVVPYNRDLMLRYRPHINVEWCTQTRAVKYLFKYIHKGPDYVSAGLDKDEDGVVDEIKNYYNCRYVSACKAAWKILGFPTHYRSVSVEKLCFHLPNREVYVHDEDEPLESILKRVGVSVSMFLGDCSTQPGVVWEATYEYLTDDILYRRRLESGYEGLNLSTEQIKNIALQEIQDFLESRGRSLKKFKCMPKPDNFMEYNGNRLIDDELNYNAEDQRKENERLLAMITDEQKGVYEEILDAVLNNKGGVFFVYGFGGTGKTFRWSCLSTAIRSRGKIVINTASSGIAALLLEGGRTAHSRLPVRKPFGGKVVVFGGDFRQILPVIPHDGRSETVMATINSSALWDDCKVLQLTKNMRLLAGLSDVAAAELKAFSEWILVVGDGKVNTPNDGVVDIDIPKDLLIKDCGDPMKTIVKEVYGNLISSQHAEDFYQHRAILSPTNKDVDQINDYMLSLLPGELHTYLSADSIAPNDKDPSNKVTYPTEFLNGIKVSGLPKQCLKLKIGAPVMCLRNIDPKGGLCNSTRLIVTHLARHVIEGRIITGTDKVGDKVLIPRMFVTPPEPSFLFRMRRRLFPVTLAFALTINKSQDQSLQNFGLFLPRPVFSHGQLYVALSKVKSRSGLKILITDKSGNVQKKTTNVVYKDMFSKIFRCSLRQSV